jgi:hypothetical protein
MTDRQRLALWAAGAGASTAILRLASLNLQLDRDEGEYATLAWLWRTGAGLPYRDWLEQKPPLAVAMNALAQAIWSDGVLGLRLVSWAWILATVLALFFLLEALAAHGRMGWRLQRHAPLRAHCAGLSAVLAACVLSASRSQSLAANTETWQNLPLLGALAFLYLPDAQRLRARQYVAAGCLIGLASLFKQTALAAVLVLPLASQERGGGGRPSNQWSFEGSLLKSVLWTLAGALLPWVLVWTWFQSRGAGLDFLQCTVAYNQAYVLQGLSGSWARAMGLLRWLEPELGGLALLAVLGWRALGRDRAPRGWLAAWIAVGLLALGSSGHYYSHYAILLLPPLAVLASVGLLGLLRNGPGWTNKRAPRALRGVLAALSLCGFAWSNGALWTQPTGAERTRHVYGVTTFVTAPLAAERIQQLCPEGKNLFIWGDEAELYYLSQRRPSCRFLFTYPFTGEAPPWPDGEDELLTGLMDLNTGAAVMSKGLDSNQALQYKIFHTLRDQYEAENSAPGFILGARKR